MTPSRELTLFATTLAALVTGFFAESLLGGKVLSSADVMLTSASFRYIAPANYEPTNRLLMDPTLQFEPWVEFNRRLLRSGRFPLWNSASGCGTPHLANGQAAVFDPFLLIAYLGTLPAAFGWMAAARLWFAGLGMYLLARSWGMELWGRWFTGLTFPFCGFLIVWLLYPVTNVAVWLPWIFLATGAVWERATWRRVALLAGAVGGAILGGHVQTAAHVLVAAWTYVAWLTLYSRRIDRSIVFWTSGLMLGVCLAAIEVVPLGAYLTRSPVWGDRDHERISPWRFSRPRVFEMACTALPSIYGSQRRGEPNLAKAIGADNQNEAAGGYAGLATLIWLAPLSWTGRRGNPRIVYLVGLTLFGACAAFRLPPVDNLLRVLPVLKVTDNRRLTLWVAFGLVMLGGFGLDRLTAIRERSRWRVVPWSWVAIAGLFTVLAFVIARSGAEIHERAWAHYQRAARTTPGAIEADYRERARRQADATVVFLPRILLFTAAEGVLLATMLMTSRRGGGALNSARSALLGITLAELIYFGYGLNPSIDLALNRPMTPLLASLQREVGHSGRVIGLGAEFPPNSLMRYGLLDPRNYDSVELTRNLDWFQRLYDPMVAAQTSRREITWERVDQARDRLRVAGVRAIVAADAPPPGFRCSRVEEFSAVRVAWLDADPLINLAGPGKIVAQEGGDGRFSIEVETHGPAVLRVAETYDPGWIAQVDGVSTSVEADRGVFLRLPLVRGHHKVNLYYDPIEFKIGLFLSLIAALGIAFALTGILDVRSTQGVVPRLGRTQAFGLESDSRLLPGRPTR